MPNAENLIPNSERTPSERRANASKAGKASGKARRAKRTMREVANLVLDMSVSNGKKVDVKSIKSLAEVSGKNIKVQDALVLTLVKNALTGNIKAFQMLIELTEQSSQAGATAADDELSASLKELAKELKSDE
jgi:hypothetical protein|nr:MAG TPA: hypothetical protein [Caudoviricetes sp.]